MDSAYYGTVCLAIGKDTQLCSPFPEENFAQASNRTFHCLCTSYSAESFGLAHVLQNPIAEIKQTGIFDNKITRNGTFANYMLNAS